MPLLAYLYVRQKDVPKLSKKAKWKFQTKLELAAALLRTVADRVKHLGKPLWVVTDGAYAKKVFQALERKRVETFRKPPVDATPEAGNNYEFDENLANSGMPVLSKAVFDLSDWPLIIRRRRALYRIWAESLGTYPGLEKVFDALPESVCPWAFPVLMNERARYDHQLRARGVPLFTFGETLHPLLAQSEPAAREDAEFLSRNLLLLSVDQRLSDEVVAECCRIVNEFYDSGAVALR